MKRLAAYLFALGCSGCALPGMAPPPECETEPTDPFRELLVVDASVLTPAGSDATELPWSPPALLRATGSGAWLARGLERWRDAARVDGNERAAEALDGDVLCRWLRAQPANGCDEACVRCDARQYSEDRAPFRTLAVANRTDLRLLPDARSPAGEGRVALGLAPPSGSDAPSFGLTLIFEYALGGSVDTWASHFHDLGAMTDAQATGALAGLVTRFVSASPAPDGGPALSQLRVSIQLDDESSELRELAPGADGELALRGLRNTPRLELDGTPELAALARNQAPEIRAGLQVVPAEMLAGAQRYGAHAWSLADVDADTRTQFDRGTCAGCHAHDGTDGGFHLSPFTLGRAGVSRFLFDPGAEDDELRRRDREQRAVVCAAR